MVNHSKDKKKQTCFDKAWLEHEDFSQWSAKVKNEPTKYRCKIYHKANGLSNVAIGALKVHLKGPSHEANAKKIRNFFRSSASPTSTHTLASHCHQPQHQGKIDEIVANSAVSEVEIQWTLKSVVAGYSNNSYADCECFLTQVSLRSIILVLISYGILSILGLVLISRTL